ncbi:unnamed protein product [Adineta ricciae]|uniref:Uncharacterized protein n=1 Tax=Adineta ricciae TaxID=249248 RepID=A0A815NAI7_ADIRI|nr:unnamed protein product [Adineta ricciae]
MTKRSLDVENKENESESNSATTNDPLPAKKPKLIAQTNDHEDEKEVEHDSDGEEDEEDEVVEEEEEEEGPISISQVIELNEGTIHPKHKEYFIYEGTDLSMVSRTARFWSRKYLQALRHVNPDAYNMYIHNDFVCYGELEVLENCLIDLAKGTLLKHKGQMNSANCITAFRRLEALTIVLKEADNFVGMDDGDRFVAILRVIGACYVTILGTLLPKSLFHNGSVENEDDIKKLTKLAQQLPNFKEVLKQALIRARLYLQIGDARTAYINVLYTIYCHWSTIIDKNRIDLNVKSDEQDEEIWEALKCAARIKKTAYKESFNFLKELEIYSKMYPDLGGHSHDLRKWSKTRRNMYSFDNMDDEPVGNFWLRL